MTPNTDASPSTMTSMEMLEKRRNFLRTRSCSGESGSWLSGSGWLRNMDRPDLYADEDPDLASPMEGERHSLTVTETEGGTRIDRLLAARLAP